MDDIDIDIDDLEVDVIVNDVFNLDEVVEVEVVVEVFNEFVVEEVVE